MMKAFFRYTSAFAVLLQIVISPVLNAQVLPERNLEIGAGAGVFVYQGDLTPERIGSFKTMKPGLQIFVNKIISSNLSYRLNFAIASLKGDESKYANPEYRQFRNLKFRTPVIELSALGIWDIRGKNFDRSKGVFSPYLLSGAGLSLLNIKPDNSGFNAEYFINESKVLNGLITDSEKKLPELLPFIPVGVGFRYELSNRFAVYTETMYRFVFTDYLDGFSYAANPEKDDHYLSQTIGLIYKLGKQNRMGCPVVK